MKLADRRQRHAKCRHIRVQHAVASRQRLMHDFVNRSLAVPLHEMHLIRPVWQRAPLLGVGQPLRHFRVGKHRIVISLVEVALQQARIGRVLHLKLDAIHRQVPAGLIGGGRKLHHMALRHQLCRHHLLGHVAFQVAERTQLTRHLHLFDGVCERSELDRIAQIGNARKISRLEHLRIQRMNVVEQLAQRQR